MGQGPTRVGGGDDGYYNAIILVLMPILCKYYVTLLETLSSSYFAEYLYGGANK